MKERHINICNYLFFILIITEVVFIVLLGFKEHDNVSFNNEPARVINDEWTFIDDSGVAQRIDLPVKLDAGDDKTVMISRKLPTDIRRLTTVGILSAHQSMNAYIDDVLIYSTINKTDSDFNDIPAGNLWNIIELPPNSEGSIITLEIYSEYEDYAGRISEVHAGTKSSLLIHYIDTSGLSLILAIITLFNGFTLIMIYLFLNKLINTNQSILYLGWFSILASIWMIMESNLTQVFMKNEFVISSFTYLSLITFPIPILLYVALIERFHYKKLMMRLSYFFLGNAFALILLQLFNRMDFHESLILVRAELFLVSGIVFYTLCLELFHYHNEDIKTFTISTGILLSFGVIELMSYYFKTEKTTGTFFQFGFLLFTIVLAWDTLKKVAAVIKLSESAKHYKFLAYRDFLTNCRNRISYAKDLDRITPDKEAIIFMADVNNMKYINDTYGHHAGDEVIILCSQCLLKVFGRRVYRIGGDEFVCIEYDQSKEDIEIRLKAFLLECDQANSDSPYAFEVSVGYAIFDKSKDKNIYDTVQRADKDMYVRKNRMKE